MARERHSAVATFLERESGGRGTGVVKTTGSYEGSLTMEGIPGSHEPSSFTRRWSRRPWRLPRHPVHAATSPSSPEPIEIA